MNGASLSSRCLPRRQALVRLVRPVVVVACVVVLGVVAAPRVEAMRPDTDPAAGTRCAALFAGCSTVAAVDDQREPAGAHLRWRWPLVPTPEVLQRFARPRSAYGAGHRGVDLAARADQHVLAVADGVVLFVGPIGGKPTIAVGHANGIRSTYEPVHARVAKGDHVRAGEVLGTVVVGGSHCTFTCVHLGALRGQTYLDPLTLLGVWRVRLLPWR